MTETYIIGEIGQNHNGSVELAKKLIDLARLPVIDSSFAKELAPIDAIKLQKRDLKQELTDSEMNKIYDSPNSFGKTYGEHREFLELSDEEHFEIYKYAKEKGLDVVETICAPGALSLLEYFQPDRLKVASRDLTNIPLLEAMAETKIPIILSTGMAGPLELDEALAVIKRWHNDITILHCLAEYPAHYDSLNLKTLTYLQNNYPEYTIGYSDHSIGIVMPVVAVALGAKVIEKHITLSRSMKGSDHEGSLGPDGVFRMVRDIRNMELALGEEEMVCHPSAKAAQVKLERSLAAKRDLKAGEIIREEDLWLLSPGTGLRWNERDKLIGHKLMKDVPANELVTLERVAESVPQPG